MPADRVTEAAPAPGPASVSPAEPTEEEGGAVSGEGPMIVPPSSSAADPVVSPADTPAVLRAYAEQLPTVLSVPNLRAKLLETADEIAALLAVGERDKAAKEQMHAHIAGLTDVQEELVAAGERDRRQIARLTEALETLLNYARRTDIQDALVQGGVDVRAVLAGEEDAG